MLKKIINNRILMFALLVIVFLCYAIKPMVGKYVYTSTGRAMSSLISGNIFTNAFVIDNNNFVVDGIERDSAKSENLFGIGVNNGTITDYDPSYRLDSVTDKIFVVQNNSEYDLVACFDLLVCLGAVTTTLLNTQLSITITEQTSGTSLTVVAKKEGNIANREAPLIAHAETQAELDEDTEGVFSEPIINCAYNGLFGVSYRAYSTTINPVHYKGTSVLTESDFKDFILVPSGQTRTFVLKIEASGTNILGLDKNAYASMNMICVKYVESIS